MIDRTQWMSITEVRAILQAASQLDDRERLMIEVFMFTGPRQCEVMALNCEDVDQRGFLMVSRAKKARSGGRDTLAISDSLLASLTDFIESRSGAMFYGQRGRLSTRTARRVFKSCIREAGLDDSLSCHSARHTVAVHLLKKTKNLRHVQKQLGHSNPATTANMYADVSFEDMKEGMTGLYDGKETSQ